MFVALQPVTAPALSTRCRSRQTCAMDARRSALAVRRRQRAAAQEEQLASLQRELAEAHARSAELSRTVDSVRTSAEDEVVRVKHALDAAQLERCEATAARAAAEERCATLQADVQRLESAVAALSADAQEAATERATLIGKADERAAQCTDLGQRLREADASLERSVNDGRAAHDRAEALHAELCAVQAKLTLALESLESVRSEATAAATGSKGAAEALELSFRNQQAAEAKRHEALLSEMECGHKRQLATLAEQHAGEVQELHIRLTSTQHELQSLKISIGEQVRAQV